MMHTGNRISLSENNLRAIESGNALRLVPRLRA